MERNNDERETPRSDELDDAVIAADDTGMISGERLILEGEIEEAEMPKGNV